MDENDKVHIREMTIADLPTVIEIENALFTDAWPISVFREDLLSPYSYPVVAQSDNDIAGYAILWIGVDEGHLTNIAVARKYQRKSVAKKLLSFILRLAREKNLAQVILEVRPSNKAAIALYRKYGFDDLAIRRNYYSNPKEDCLMMVKSIAEEVDF